jgi:hypothetical protein
LCVVQPQREEKFSNVPAKVDNPVITPDSFERAFADSPPPPRAASPRRALPSPTRRALPPRRNQP